MDDAKLLLFSWLAIKELKKNKGDPRIKKENFVISSSVSDSLSLDTSCLNLLSIGFNEIPNRETIINSLLSEENDSKSAVVPNIKVVHPQSFPAEKIVKPMTKHPEQVKIISELEEEVDNNIKQLEKNNKKKK